MNHLQDIAKNRSRTHRPRPLTLAVLGALAMPHALWAQAVPGQAGAAASADVTGASAGVSLGYTGSLSQLGLGVDRDLRFRGQGSHVLAEDALSAVVGQGWMGNGAGGLRLDYNWIAGKDERADADALVRKLFVAVDRNRDNDRKATVGAGLESERWFGSVSASHGLSGRRLIGGPVVGESTATIGGSEAGRSYVDTVTTTTTTQYFQQAYDYGFGLRGGTVLQDGQLRLSVGYDREWGDFSSRQNTFSLGAEKFFPGSPHSLGLFLERYGKSGEFETTSGRGTRAVLMYRLNFGGSVHASSAGWRENRVVRQVEVPAVTETGEARQSAAPAVQMRKEMRIVKTTASMTSDAFFEFGKAELTPLARRELDRVAEILRTTERAGNIRIAGHTCDIGTDAYNLRLSLRRAQAVRDFLAKAGLPKDVFLTEGLGERQPKYPNAGATRAKNRRVDLEFVQYRDKSEEIEVPVEVVTPVSTVTPPVTWRTEVVDREPAWVRRALRSTVPHKQSVDSYRGAEIGQTSRTVRAWANRAPVPQDDSVSVAQDRSATIEVLANDSDPDGNPLTVVAVGAAAHGMAAIAGNSVTYTPAPGYVGDDQFSYTVDDGAGGRTSANVRVTVQRTNHAPVARDDRYIVGYFGFAGLDVLANDGDEDGDSLSIVSFTQPQPAVGVVVRNGNSLTFQADGVRFPEATFSYTVSDGRGGTATATVTLIDP